ncbi:HAD family hydrolase [Thioalkalivibrio sp.]|uniref:HAD family hydrolase n=1 Tax=Thioalkalivibrio sp. TaxID=2093813 RepID=UPI00356137BC
MAKGRVLSGVRAVILDLDGTLLHSNDAHAQAFVEAAHEMGLNMEFDRIRWLIGMGGDKLIPKAFGFTSDSGPGQKLGATKTRIFMDRYLTQLQPTPGARALLLRLRDEGIRRVLATSSSESSVQPLLCQAGIEDLIEDTSSSSDVRASKPDPELVKAALDKADAPPSQVVMLGDTPYDVEAATRAGIRIIALRSGGWTDRQLHGASAIYDDPADLLEHFETSPLA